VATCGTAFGSDHIKILRRLLMDQAEFRGEVVFTFDGDSAGQKAALKAFQDDQKFVTQTFVAVEPSGMDPCELRQHKGDTAVRDLVARRVPLFEFAIRTRLATYDLDTAEGRTAATRAGMEVVRDIRDVSLRANYARQLAGWIGLPDPDELVRQSRGGVGNVGRRPSAPASQIDLHDPSVRVERDALKLALQTPSLAVGYDELPADVFTAAPYAALHHAVLEAGGPAAAGEGGAVWVAKVEAAAPDDAARGLVRELAVEPLASEQIALTRYATEVLARLEELAATRRIAEVKSRLQRINPVEASAEYNRLFGELVAFEAHRRALRERAIGTL
jgi:DNA primase